MKNKEVSDILFDFSEFLAMEDVPFKPRAYEKAAQTIESLDEDVAGIYKKGGLAALERIPGVGKSIAQKIEEYLTTGKVKELLAMQKKMPVDLDELRRVEGLGPKMIKALYKEIGIKNISDLKEAALGGKIQHIAHFGKKSEQKIIKGIEFLESSGGRFRLGDILPVARELEKKVGSLRHVKKITVAGSIRRWQETVGDIDILVETNKPDEVMDFFVSLPEVRHVYAKGDTKSSVRFAIGIDVDLRVIPARAYGAALQYFTGSKDHNVLLRKIAIKKGLKLNEYGLFRGKKQIAGVTEESIYKTLSVKMPIPELRRGVDEFKRVARDIIGFSDLRGDLQIQTDWTDGADSIKTMVAAAEKLGHEYIAITDHTRSLAMTGGSDEKKLLMQIKEIDRIQKNFKNIKILKGAEVNILKDGSLDINDRVLGELDVVGAAIHSHFNLSENEQTARIIRAMENPHVDIIFHPTGRVLKKREPYKIDIDALLRRARETNTIMEIDAHPYRLDLNDEHIRRGIEYGVLFSIDTDAHSVAHLPFLEYGIGQARRAGLSRKSVVNTLGLEALQKYFRTPKSKRSNRFLYDN